MIHDTHQKVTTSHLKRNAYLYVRQSTLRQVFENTESTKRQYALRQHAIALGWAQDQIVVIDTDLGQSGASRDREGFQRLVTAVGHGLGFCVGVEGKRREERVFPLGRFWGATGWISSCQPLAPGPLACARLKRSRASQIRLERSG